MMLLRRFQTLVLTGLFAACLGCSSIEYANEQAPDVKFGELTKYAIVNDWSGKEVVRIHPKAMSMVNKVIEKNLQDHGFTRSYPGVPDFTVTYRLEAEWDPKLSEEEKRQRLGFSGGRFPDADPRSRNYQKMVFVIEMASPKDKKMIWRGTATGTSYNPGDSGYQLSGVADTILKSFPPK